VSTSQPPPSGPEPHAQADRPATQQLPVVGMHCAACAGAIERLVAPLPGVTSATVSFGTQRLHVEGETSYEALREALSKGGYQLGLRTTTLRGLSPEARAAVAALPGVRTVRNGDAGLLVEHVDAAEVLDQLRALLGSGGGLETESDPEGARLSREASAWRRRVLLGLPATLYLLAMNLSALRALLPPVASDLRTLFFVGAFVQFGIGRPFLASAARSLRTGRPDMNVLIALGTLTAFFYSSWLAWFASGGEGGKAHFEMSAIIILLVALGRWLEARARRTMGSAVARLARLEPETAWLLESGSEDPREVPLVQVLVGDRLRIRPGSRVPADGVVLSGRSTLDESLLTGESMPVTRSVGDPLSAGTTNGSGSLDMEVRAVGSDTVLRTIVEWVARAQGEKAPVARLADRVAAVFVPIVLGIAVLTLGAWFLFGGVEALGAGVEAAIAVLLIACPCALGLATPTAIVVGTGRAASRGILIKGGEVLEQAARVQEVIFDKTGTLTRGVPEVVGIEVLDGIDADRMLARAGALERHSEHPLAAAIARAATERGLESPPAREFQSEPGGGATGFVGAVEVHLGTRAWLSSHEIDADPLDPLLHAADAAGATAVLVALQRRPAGLIAIRDTLRPSAVPCVRALRAMGIGVVVLSGDRQAAVDAVAHEVGADTALGETRPIEKAGVVAARTRVAMVGDGVNDAPALASADVGIAVGGATDVATAAAGIALVRADLERIPEALRICRATLRTIRQNLFWAFGYNVIGIPLAALGWLHPMFAAGAMALSSVSVLTNSLRLRTLDLRDRGHTG
jgi:Cu+-exporting ATPase